MILIVREIVIIIYIITSIWLLWSAMSEKKRKRKWIGPLLLFVILIIGSYIVNRYLSNEYNFSLLPSGMHIIFSLFITILIMLVVYVLIVLASAITKSIDIKPIKNLRSIWMITIILAGTILFYILWLMPILQKFDYVHSLEDAFESIDAKNMEDEFSLAFVRSEDSCRQFVPIEVSWNTNECQGLYTNVFYIRNNLEETKEVQVKIRVANIEQEELKEMDSIIMQLSPGEIQMVRTEETNNQIDIWRQYSFTTEEQASYYQYFYRYRDPS